MSYDIRRAAVIGAGTMGAAIAALLASVGIPVTLLDIVPEKLTPEEEAKGLTLKDKAVRNRFASAGLDRALKARPAAFMTPKAAELITIGNTEDDFDRLAEADWIVEVIIEQLAPKQALMARIEGVRKPDSIVTTNTSGIPVASIAAGRSPDFKSHFLGTHFFNPPRYLKLLEVIPTADTSQAVLDYMIEFGEKTLGKGVVVCKDTPNFIGNRLLSIAGAYTMHYALEHGFTVEEVDNLTGPLIGHPKTATFRLNDLVGIDVLEHVSRNLYPLIPNDESREILNSPLVTQLMKGMLDRKWLGGKTNVGFYKEVKGESGREFWSLDLKTMEHVPPAKVRFESVGAVRNLDNLGERLQALISYDDRAAQFTWATLSYAMAYASRRVPEIADSFTAIDNALKWGFGHELGPFEMWDALGVAETVARMEKDGTVVAPWVKEMLAAGCPSFYQRVNGRVVGYYDLNKKGYTPLAVNPNVIVLKDEKAAGKEIAGNDSASLVNIGDGVLCLEFHSKANALDPDIWNMMQQASDILEKDYVGLVIGNQGEHFCAGANLMLIVGAAQSEEWNYIDEAIKALQGALMNFRYSPKPVVAAPFSMTLGGGAEVVMGSSAACAAAEAYIGLVEVGAGVIPAGGGCKELLRRVLSPVMQVPGANPLPFLQKIFEQIGLAKVATSAAEAREMGFLAPSDRIIMNKDHLLAEAKKMVLQMAAAGYRPPARTKCIWAAGRDALAALRVAIYGLVQGGYASEHDAKIANKLAYILCGGELTTPQWVDEQYILDLEREAFLSLCGEPKTHERIWALLQTGKPLRN